MSVLCLCPKGLYLGHLYLFLASRMKITIVIDCTTLAKEKSLIIKREKEHSDVHPLLWMYDIVEIPMESNACTWKDCNYKWRIPAHNNEGMRSTVGKSTCHWGIVWKAQKWTKSHTSCSTILLKTSIIFTDHEIHFSKLGWLNQDSWVSTLLLSP